MLQATVTSRWIKANSEWLDASHPLAAQAVLIAKSMDADMKNDGSVKSALFATYRLTMGDLERMKPAADDADALDDLLAPQGRA